jgi:hypothetical protein
MTATNQQPHIDFDDLMDRLNSDVWCDLRERPRLRIALETLCPRMPVEVYEELSQMILFAPDPWKNAAVFPMPKSRAAAAAIIYISPRMEEESQEQNNFTVAHEFAHASLRHQRYEALSLTEPVDYLDEPNEIVADALVKQWGYEIPAHRIKAKGAGS